MAEQEDDDYMSNTFLNTIEKEPKKPTEIISPNTLEIINRNTGLETKLNSSNKGFRMLQKMGYKSTQEPIKIVLKNDKFGLGTKRKLDSFEKNNLVEKEILEELQVFRKSQKSRVDSRLLQDDVLKCRLACQDLDEKAGLSYSEFWPLESKPLDELGLVEGNPLDSTKGKSLDDLGLVEGNPLDSTKGKSLDDLGLVEGQLLDDLDSAERKISHVDDNL